MGVSRNMTLSLVRHRYENECLRQAAEEACANLRVNLNLNLNLNSKLNLHLHLRLKPNPNPNPNLNQCS